MKIRPFQALCANTSMIASNDTFFENIKEEFSAYHDSDFYEKTNEDGFYILQIKSKFGVHTGLLCGVDIREYLEGNILKHENTLSSKEQKMVHLFLKRKAHIKPVLLTYDFAPSFQQKLWQITQTSLPIINAHFEKLNETHTVFAIHDIVSKQEIIDYFEGQVTKMYIADGHHRCSTSAYLYHQYLERKQAPPTENIFAAIFGFNELRILDYNRIVDCLIYVSPAHLMAALATICDIRIQKTPRKPLKNHEFTMIIGRECFSLTWKKRILNQYKSQGIVLDSTILDDLVFRDIIGIKDVKTDNRIEYVEGAKGLGYIETKSLKKETCVGFCLYPVSINEVVSISEAGKIMPPKSTWFEPRIKNGLLVYEF